MQNSPRSTKLFNKNAFASVLWLQQLSDIETSCDHSWYQLDLMKRLCTLGFDVHTPIL